jgi:hypothetical protein
MKRLIVHERLLPAMVLAALAMAIAIPGIAHAGPAEPAVPIEIAVADGHKLFLVAHALGVQIHECIPNGSGYRWRFLGPRANLYDDQGTLIATHFSGPSWQARDGSKVTATLDGNASVTVDPTAIPWLRLQVISASAGPDGDRLAATKYIQRIRTTSGLAPAAASCNEATFGDVAEVPYTADYAFWKATAS